MNLLGVSKRGSNTQLCLPDATVTYSPSYVDIGYETQSGKLHQICFFQILELIKTYLVECYTVSLKEDHRCQKNLESYICRKSTALTVLT